MNTASSMTADQGNAIPLSNLFAYIRDLFDTNDPVYRFKDTRQAYWPLASWRLMADELAPEIIQTQWDDPCQPLLTLRKTQVEELSIPEELVHWITITEHTEGPATLTPRKEIVIKFEHNPGREIAFQEFAQKIEGKKLDEVADVAIPEILQGWINLFLKDEQICIERKDLIERFEEDDHRMQMFETFQRVYNHNRSEQWYAEQVNQLYESLHTLHYELKSHPQAQLYLSFGLLAGKIGGEKYQNYLFHLPLQLRLTQQQIRIETDPLAQSVMCEQHFSPLLEKHFSHESAYAIRARQEEVLRQVEQFNNHHVPFQWDQESVMQYFYQTAANMLKVFPQVQEAFWKNREVDISFHSQIPENGVLLSFSPIIQVKKEEPRFHISRDAAKIIETINILIDQDRTSDIPVFFKRLFSARKPSHPLHIVHKNVEPNTAEIPQHKDLPPVLFPLPYNREQQAIAYRLEEQDAVTIQGPPGTGKSHTIANIAAHYVAQGKSILIVSKNAKALDVIRNKLPESLKPLAVSWMESDKNIEQLKYAIDALKEHLGRNYVYEKVEKLEKQLQTWDVRFEELVQQLEYLLSLHDERISIHNPYTAQKETKSASDWAKWLIKYPKQRSYLLDEIDAGQEQQEKLPELVATYIKLGSELDPQYLDLTGYEYPDPINWITPDSLSDFCQELKRVTAQIDIADYQHIPVHTIDDNFLQMWEIVENYLDTLDQSQDYIQQPNFDFGQLAKMLTKHHHVIQIARKNFWEHEWDLSPVSNEEPETLLEQALSLRKKYGDQRQLSLLKRTTLSKIQKKILSCKIDRLNIENIDQLQLLTDYLEHLCQQKSLSILLGNYLAYLQLPWNPQDWRNHLERLIAINHAWEGISHFNDYLHVRNLPTLEYQNEEFEAQVAFVAGLGLYKHYQYTEDKLHQALASLRLTHTYSAPLMKSLLDAANKWEDNRYKQLLEQYESEREMVKMARESMAILDQITAIAPHTASDLLQKYLMDSPEEIPSQDEIILDIKKELFQQQLRRTLEEKIMKIDQTEKGFSELKHIQQQQEKVTEELIAYKTWYHKTQTINDDERAALTAWRNDLINIGKGQGKNSSRNMAAAIENMQRAKSVVPIWIMQQDTAIRFFADPMPGQFDLLIVDEASQCDISMLNLIFRAKKSMIVGDENQTATAMPPSQFPIDRTNQILDRYLRNHPYREQFNINNRSSSIYSLSGVIYPNIITLLEHFRCRPEIIGYSNQYIYNKQLVPLKTAAHHQYGQPVEVFYLEEDSQNKKRVHIVEKVNEIFEQILDDYEGGQITSLPTMGVLTLDSSNEHHLDQLIRVLSRNPRIRKYEEDIQLIIGTARKFQGDERDIMIMTSTAIHRKNAKGILKPPRAAVSEEMMRIYNVAASRAREKSVLIHCIAPEAVGAMNPNCYRKKLIDYYSMFQQAQEHTEPDLQQLLRQTTAAPGSYQREICEYLVSLGLGSYLRPNYKIGHYQLDFAIIKDANMLALLCDDPNRNISTYLQQQLVLQRVGWKSFYVSAIMWHYQQEEVKLQLQDMLKEVFQ